MDHIGSHKRAYQFTSHGLCMGPTQCGIGQLRLEVGVLGALRADFTILPLRLQSLLTTRLSRHGPTGAVRVGGSSSYK